MELKLKSKLNVHNYMILIDEIRYDTKISKEDFCEGICDGSSYRRMLNGTIVPKQEKLFAFLEKLEIASSDFYYLANERERSELRDIYKAYTMIYSHDYSKIKDTLSKISKKKLISKQNEKFLDFCTIKAKLHFEKENKSYLYDLLKKLVDYPNCLKKEIFGFVDINVLMSIAEIQVEDNSTEAITKLIDILSTDTKFVSRTDISYIYTTIYGNIALLLCRLNRYDECIKLASSGIKYSLKYCNTSSLAQLHYVKSYSLLMIGKTKKAEIEAARCISSAVTKQNNNELKIFFMNLKKDFGINPIDLLKRHFN